MKPLISTMLMSFLLGLCACDSTFTISRATGIAYEVVVVMDKVAWDGTTGTAIKEELTSPVPYLPQSESSMRITYARPDQFNGMLKYVRNILIVNIDKSMYTKVSLLRESDKWTKGQAIIYLNAPDGESVETFLANNQRVLVEQYTKEEMKRAQDLLHEKYSAVVMKKVKDKFGITLYAPEDMTASANDSIDCLWFSNNATTGRMDLIIYSFPFTDPNTFTLEYLVDKRDSVAKYTIPGSFPGSYMSTEKRVVDYFASTLHGKYCGIVRGLWRMEGDMMGGPFVSYARVDEKNKRVIVTEGFVYEPAKEKKNYIRRLEAALQTMRLPDEQEPKQAEIIAEEEKKNE